MAQTNTVTAKPFLKWAGGKGSVLPQLTQFFPASFQDYYEPFVGGGAVFFSLPQQSTAHLNDINSKLMAAYRQLQQDAEPLIKELQKIEQHYVGLDEGQREAYYYQRRDRYNQLSGGLQKTVLLLFLNRTCFNGLYRENSRGEFNVPFGRYKNPTICHTANLQAAHQALQSCVITDTPFSKAVETAKAGDFVYFDPPYYPLTATSNFTAYHQTGFSADDQQQLRDLFVTLHKRGCLLMLSNSTADFITQLYKDFRQETLYAGRNINAKANQRGKIAELLVLNY